MFLAPAPLVARRRSFRPRRRFHMPRRRPSWRRLAGLATTVVLVALAAIATHATLAPAGPVLAGPARCVGRLQPERVSYRPPVAGEVHDPFRPPPHPYGPGNRGLEYDTAPGDPVYASADGTVTFAGLVAGSLHVTVRHADGVRTTYAFLDQVDVARGQRVTQGDVVGAAGERLHFSARVGDAYVDPAALFDAGATVVELLPFEIPPGSDPEQEAAREAADRVQRHGGPELPSVDLLDIGSAYDWLRARAEGVGRAWDDVSPAGWRSRSTVSPPRAPPARCARCGPRSWVTRRTGSSASATPAVPCRAQARPSAWTGRATTRPTARATCTTPHGNWPRWSRRSSPPIPAPPSTCWPTRRAVSSPASRWPSWSGGAPTSTASASWPRSARPTTAPTSPPPPG